MVGNWLQSFGAASDSDSVADPGFDHKRVLEVTDAVALLGLSPLDAWKQHKNKRRGDLEPERLEPGAVSHSL